MKTKYGFDISKEIIHQNVQRLTNQLWKLIPMREKKEDWKKQLETVILEIVGQNEIFSFSPLFLQLLSKLEGLRLSDLEFIVYRKTVFECINLLQEIDKSQ